MAFTKEQQEEHEDQMMQSKLSGSLPFKVTFDVDWTSFDAFAENMLDYLKSNHEYIKLTKQEVLNNIDVYEYFKQQIETMYANTINYSIDEDDMEWYNSERFFRPQVQAAKAEEHRIREEELKNRKEQEEKRLAEQKALEANGMTITVDPKKHKMAVAILKAAGLIK